ncbi:cytochrome P450 [Patellaria atrata CBS 101060]|uniref:Cytochrome P450 n=1 Tax=Patellaria atrata CBS 101060 TaxID=1346257 RepID=A0A9P4SAG2_9PEZI|nr:cytochrome P450 [Patellaria atrata CBS 101060]
MFNSLLDRVPISFSELFIVCCFSTFLYFIISSTYNVYFHPLARFPGPRLWIFTRLCYANSLRRGDLHLKILEFHEKYGEIVRVAPNELSFTSPSAWKDMCTGSTKNKGLPRNTIVFGAQGFKSFLDGSDEQHTMFRRMLAPSFSVSAMNRAEPTIQSYISLLITQLNKEVTEKQPVNICEWYNYFTFDITGELAFSESFGQLERKAYHQWVKLIFSHLKYSALSICLRFWPPLDVLMPKLAPASLHKLKHLFCQLSRQKVAYRINRPDASQLQDWVSPCLTTKDPREKMELEEIMDTFTIFIIAGSETTATLLSGLTNHLCQNKRVLKLLSDEIRGTFKSEDEITQAAAAKLPYLNAVLNEALRMCTPIPCALGRIVPKGGSVISGEHIPTNTYVGIPHFAAYHDATHFASPFRFTPERWLGDAAFEKDLHPVFQPFSMGGRNCIGQALAWVEMRLVIARLIYNFDMKKAEGPDWIEQRTYMLWEKQPFSVHLTPVQRDEAVELPS